MDREIHAVTGAFGFSGKYIAQRLLAKGFTVRTLTNSPERESPLAGAIQAFPLAFHDPVALAASLEGVKVLYVTYWVRFNHATFTHADAVRNTIALFNAAKAAGVERVVYVSITNADPDSPLEYFSGKGRLENVLKDSGLSYAILRPAVLFGDGGILINNIAWTLRRLPVFCVFGNGGYHIQPIFVDDLARLAVEWGAKRDNVTVPAIGPEDFTYRGLVSTIGAIIGHTRPIVGVPPTIGYWAAWLIGRMVNDIFVTREEITGLMSDLLHVPDAAPTGTTKLTDWAREHSATLGARYENELARREDRKLKY